MKKTFLLKTMLLLFALIVGMSSAWATDETITWNISGVNTTANGAPVNTTLKTSSVTGGSGTWTAVSTDNSYAGNSSSSGAQLGSGNYPFNGTISLSSSSIPSSAIIKSIAITLSSSAGSGLPYTVSATVNNTSFGSSQSVYGSSQTKTFSGSTTGNGIVLSFSCSSKKNVIITKLAVTYEVTSPTINASSPVNYAADITTGEIPYTISSPVSGKSLNATSDDAWISNISVGSDKVTFNMTENEGEARTGTITLSYEGATSKDITINQAAAVTKYTVTIETPDNGTLVVKRGDNTLASGAQVPVGTELTIEATPNEGYKFRNWQAIDASTHTYSASNTGTYTITDNNVTFKANFDARVFYNVNWSVNGIITKTEKYEEGNTIVFPETPADIAGKAFVGWVTAAMDGTTDEAPEFVTSATMGTADVTYYAVFANRSGGSETATLTESEIKSNFTNTTMAYGTPKTFEDTSDGIVWQISGYTDAANRPWIQLKAANNAYMKITASNNISEVKLTISSAQNSSGGIADITKHSAFDGKVCLESTAKGTPAGELGSSQEIENNTVTVSLTSAVKELYVQVTKGARVWGVEVLTNSYTYSGYCTTVPAPESVSATIASSGYTTFCSPFDLSFENVESLEAAYVVTTSTAETATLKKVTAVPAGTGVILKGTTGPVTIPVAEYTGEAISNILEGTLTATHVDTETVYVVSDGKFKLFAGTEIPAGKAYLPASALTGGAPSLSFDFGGETTGINSVERGALSVEGCYTLDGRRVAQPTKGLYIVNGKKVVIK